MARLGYKLNGITVNSTQPTNFQAFLAANLTTWTVGPIVSFGAGVLQRDYFILTSNITGEQILVFIPSGTSMNVSNSIYAPYQGGYVLGTSNLPLSFSLSPLGNFNLANDPLLAPFWAAAPDASKVYNVNLWTSGTTQYVFVFEDNGYALFALYNSPTNGASPHPMIVMCRFIDPTYCEKPFMSMNENGLWILTPSTGSPPPPSTNRIVLWSADALSQIVETRVNPLSFALTGLNSTDQPSPFDNTFVTEGLPLLGSDNGTYMWKTKNELFRYVGRTTATFNQKHGGSNDLIHMCRDMWSLWAAGLAAP